MISLKKTPFKRGTFFLFSDIVLLSLSVYIAFLLRFGSAIPETYLAMLLPTVILFVSLKVSVFALTRVYKISWSYFGMYEMWNIVKALGFAFCALAGLSFILRDFSFFHGLPRSIFFIDFICSLFLVSGLRIFKRFYLHVLKGVTASGCKRALVIGAGNAGEQIVRDMKRNSDSAYRPVGFIDDNSHKANLYIHGVKVFGGRRLIPDVVRKLDIEVIIIAMPSVFSKEVRDILTYVREAGVTDVKTIPGLDEILHGNKVTLSDIKRVRIEDILGREQAVVEGGLIADSLNGKRILVTGAGGSIGMELIRQVLRFRPERVVALDIDETELFHIEQEVKEDIEDVKLCLVVGDIRDAAKMKWVFANHLPHVVFHAAAYKHVPIMEEFPEEAVKTNILGTKNIAEMAVEFQVEQFIMVSTDKAVRPTNVMGATKRVAEKIVKELNRMESTRFISVRFGNVVGSRGSVIPTFQRQIRQGGPVTITHAEMTRYFMSIPEAVTLILQAGAMGSGGEVFVLDMGDPIKIVDVAKEMIRLHGLKPEIDIPIVYSGIRPGEKMYEELLTAKENLEPTAHSKIFKAKDHARYDDIQQKVPLLEDMVVNPDPGVLRAYLKELVSSYHPNDVYSSGRPVI